MSRTYRKERLDQLLWQELNTIVLYELDDPRLADISIRSVDVSQDLQTARVYVTLLDSETDARQVTLGLENARGYLRSQIAMRVHLRKAPDLYFKIDNSYQEALRVDAILDALPPVAEVDAEQGGDAE